MKIKLTSLMVNDQDQALKFYTEVLGFVKKNEFPVGPYKWLTVVSPDGYPDVELSLEPNANPAAKAFQEAMFAQKIPMAAFENSDINGDYDRLRQLGVVFLGQPADMGAVRMAILSDGCGNLITLYQPL